MLRKKRVSEAVALALAGSTMGLPHAVQAQADAPARIEEIIVTATRRETALQDTAVAVSVIGQGDIESLNIDHFQDYLKYLPNLQAEGAQPGGQFMEMRGIAANGGNVFQAGGVDAAASVAVYLDDAPITAGVRNVDLYVTDIARVEVLSGPQGTLFGSASMAGAVRLITNKPSMDGFNANFELGAGSTDGSSETNYNFEGFLNIPIAEDRFAVRIAAYNDYQGGFLDNTPGSMSLAENRRIVGNAGGRYDNLTSFVVLDNSDYLENDVNDVEYTGARLSALASFSDDWSLLFQHTNQNLLTGGPFTYRDDIGDLQILQYNPAKLDDDVNISALTVEGRLAALDVIYNGSFMDRDVEQVIDYSWYTQSGWFLPYYACDFPDYTHCSIPRQDYTSFGHSEDLTHEIRLASDTSNRFSFILGYYYNKSGCDAQGCGVSQNFNYYGSIDQGFPRNAPISTATSFDPNPRPPGTMFFNDISPTVEENAFFGQVTAQLSEDWSITAGLRSYEKDLVTVGSANFGNRGVDRDSGQNLDARLNPANESDTIPLLTVSYTPTDNLLLYGTYSEGFTTGGFNRNGGPGWDGSIVPDHYHTETTQNLEFGWKASLLDGRLRFNGAIFNIDWNDIVVNVLDETISLILFQTNAGNAKVNGLEADFTYLIDGNWTLAGSIAVVDSEITHVPPSASSRFAEVGTPLARQPDFAGNLRVQRTFQVGGMDAYAMLGAIYKGSAWNGVSPTRVQMESYTLLDANFTIDFGERMTGRVFAHNLTNERNELAISRNEATGQITKTIGRPRTIGVKLSYSF